MTQDKRTPSAKYPFVIDQLFICPRCGGRAFGTIAEKRKRDGGVAWSKAEGHCGTVGCSFTWQRRNDWRVFVFTYRASTRTEFNRRFEEYDRVSLNPRDHEGRICR